MQALYQKLSSLFEALETMFFENPDTGAQIGGGFTPILMLPIYLYMNFISLPLTYPTGAYQRKVTSEVQLMSREKVLQRA